MPGILPMKVIKVGTGAQSRIAQACDRCRSKKIRCDGVTPCCSQCATVGFECKTSDKLSRRAFPRGYTESLEERVRALEGEVKELKDLLDEKDEKIDILSKIHSNSPQKRPSVSTSPTPAVDFKLPTPQTKEDTFTVQQLPVLLNDEKAKSCFVGASSGRAFFDALKGKIQESGKPCSNLHTKFFFNSAIATSPELEHSGDSEPLNRVPPRLISDQLINIFFQEWAPLFPILHRPTFLKLYSNYTADPESIKDKQAIAQLHLVFGIAGLSIENNKEILANSESQWQPAVDSLLSDNSVATLQCLVLAQLYCVCKADYSKLLRYNGVAITFAYRLGLHQSQKRFSLGALSRETRKKVFWSLYTLDCFAAALLGLPRLLRDEDIHTEYPSDVDDENVTERGFQPTLPGESTRVSSALALFRVARIMAKVLGDVYPSASSHDISLQNISSLSDELDSWRDDLAPHLRLKFLQDKPSTDVTSSRSPVLSLAYYYIRSLIHRPAAISGLGPKASSSMVALADSSKHIIQIAQLLEERHMSFSLCLNKNELILLAGFSLLLQGLNLKQEGKLIQENQKIVRSVIEILEHNNSHCATAFKKVAFSTIASDQSAKPTPLKDNQHLQRRDSYKDILTPHAENKYRKKQPQPIASCVSFGANWLDKQECTSFRRSPTPNLALGGLAHYSPSSSQASLTSAQSEPVTIRAQSDPQLSHPRKLGPPAKIPNLDYLSFGDDPLVSSAYNTSVDTSTELSEWERLLSYTDTSQSPSHDNQYTSYFDFSPNPASTAFYRDTSPSAGKHDWSPEVWDELRSLPAPAQSVLSFSDESLTSGEDLSSCELGAEYRGILMPNLEVFEGLDGNFGL